MAAGALSHPGRKRRGPRPTALAALGARLRHRGLDRDLAAGIAGWRSPEHAARISQLTSVRHRRRLADALDNIVSAAPLPPWQPAQGAVPPCRASVAATRDQIRSLAERLRRDAPVAAAGIVRLDALLCDGAGPVYTPGHADVLAGALATATRWLDTRNEPMAVTRGRHKVFLGMAAGVGKTYRMLQEGQADALAGRDVVIGYLEPHGRAETMQQAAGLEVVPRRFVRYRDTVLEEMDLPAVLKRDPELCLIDELAHTNAPGTEHPKRYEDVEDVLATGIDVYSSVNVQHLESLNDQVAELTGTRVRETVPDAVLAAADDVVLIDITPDSLIERLLAGKVYPAERIQTALNNFFKVENLSALREVSLRQVAEEVEHKRNPLEADGRGPGAARTGSWTAARRPRSGSGCWRWSGPSRDRNGSCAGHGARAQRLGAELDVLWVTPEEEPTGEENEQLAALRKLTSVLGAHLIVEHGPDTALVTQRVARERGTTYVLMGAPSPQGALRRLMDPGLPARLMTLLPGVDLRIVADRTQRMEAP